MAIKAYRTRDKTGRASVNVPFRIQFWLGRETLVDALAWSVRNEDPDEPLPQLSDAKAVEVVRDTLWEAGGLNFRNWSDYINDDDREAVIAAWAGVIVDRVFGPAITAVEGA